MSIARARRVLPWVMIAGLVVALVFAVQRLDLARIAGELRVARLPWVVASVVFYFLLLPLWAAQWRLLAPQVARNSFRRMLGVVATASSAHNTTAFFLGEATSVVLLTTDVGLSGAQVVSVIAMDQLLVGISKLAVLVAAALTLSLPEWVTSGVVTFAAGIAALLVGTVLGSWHYDVVVKHAARIVPARGLKALEGMGHSLAPLRSPVRGGVPLLLALAKMGAEIAAILCVQHAFGVVLPPASAFVVLAAIQMATLLPLVPGNLGVYEGAIVVIYTRLGLPFEQAVAMAAVQHATAIAALALPGYFWLGRSAASARVTAAS